MKSRFQQGDAVGGCAGITRVRLFVLLITMAVFAPLLGSPIYYDDPLQLVDAAAVVEDPTSAWGLGSFGRFRPLRLLGLAGVYRWAGPYLAWPYHLLSLGVHGLNVWLLGGLLRKLTTDRGSQACERRWLIYLPLAMFAVHWAGSEAVTYLSAIGMLIVGLGGLLMAHAVLPAAGAARSGLTAAGRFGLFGVGLFIAVGGGEYWVATVPMLIGLAVWPRSPQARPDLRRGAAVGGLLVLVLGAYGLWQWAFVLDQPSQQIHLSPRQIFAQWGQILCHLWFPSKLASEQYAVWLILVMPAVAAFTASGRRYLRSARAMILLSIIGGSTLPFAFNALVNGGRFTYFASGFAWLLAGSLMMDALPSRAPIRESIKRWALPLILGAGIAMQALFLYKRIGDVRPRGESLVQLRSEIEARRRREPDGPLRVKFLHRDIEHARAYLALGGVLEPADMEIVDEIRPLASVGTTLWVDHDLDHGYRIIRVDEWP